MSLIDLTKPGSVPGIDKVVATGKLGEVALCDGILSGFPEGERNNAFTRLGGLLRARGFDYYFILKSLLSWNEGSKSFLPEKEIEAIAKSVSRYDPIPECRVPTSEEIYTVKQAYTKWMTRVNNESPIKSGFPPLDSKIPVFQPGEVFTMAGRPATCKTTIGVELGHRYAASLGGCCLFMSLEMNVEALYQRLETMARSESIGRPFGFDEIRDIAINGEAGLATDRYKNLLIVDKDGLTIDQIDAYYKMAAKNNNIPVVVIDYLGYMRDSGKGGTTYEQVSRVAKMVKGFAKSNSIRVILLCQTSREGKGGFVPVELHHLRDSGAIEESADIVLGLWHDSDDKDIIMCRVLKNRNYTAGWTIQFVKTGLALSCKE